MVYNLQIMKVTKAILPVAGKGTRVMPLTLHQPKAMIAVADKPIVHYIIDELVASGITEIILVLGPNQEVFKQYINYLQQDHSWNKIKFSFAYQKEALGDGDAIYLARKFIKKGEPFSISFCDDIFGSKEPPTKLLIDHFIKTGSPTILLEKVPMESVGKYGVIKPGPKKIKKFRSIVDLVEKPSMAEAPSNLTIVGRYVMPYEIFDYLKKLYPKKEREIKLAYALKKYLSGENKTLWGLENGHLRFDCGSKEGLIQAQAYFAIRHHHSKSNLHRILN